MKGAFDEACTADELLLELLRVEGLVSEEMTWA
jgi:hypothetical protein